MSRSFRRFTDIAIRQFGVRFNMIEVTLSPGSVTFFSVTEVMGGCTYTQIKGLDSLGSQWWSEGWF